MSRAQSSKKLTAAVSEIQSNKRKIIMEMEEEYSGSDADSARFNNDQSTWQEIQDENEALKNQILG